MEKQTKLQKLLRHKTLYKWWRVDKNLWEEKVKMLWFITYYKYSIWIEGKAHTHIKFRTYPQPRYIKSVIK